jgi:TonB family protein
VSGDDPRMTACRSLRVRALSWMSMTPLRLAVVLLPINWLQPAAVAGQRPGDAIPVALALDSVALERGLRQHALEAGGWKGWILRADDSDTVGVHTLESDLTASAIDSIIALVKRTYLLAAEGSGSVLTLTFGDAIVMRTHVPRSTRPRLTNERDVQTRIAEAARESTVGGTATLRIWVNERGRSELVIVHASSGWPQLDAMFVEIGRRTRYAPARIDDYTVPVWVQQNFTLTLR